MNLEQKQAYYEYVGGWSYKQPPHLDPALHSRLREIDPALHLLWGGVAVYRNQPDGPVREIRGDIRATKLLFGQRTPRWVSAKMLQFCGFTYRLKNGREKTVMREDAVPRSKRKLVLARYEDVHYGKLRWYLARHLTPEQLIQAGIYKEAPPPEGDYLWDMTVQTPDGSYWEPDRDWIEMVAASNHETFNTPLGALYQKDREAREEADARREALKAQETCMAPEALLKFTLDQPRSL